VRACRSAIPYCADRPPWCSVVNADEHAHMDQLVLLAARARVLLRGRGGVHRGRLQPHRAQLDGAVLEGGARDGPRRRDRCALRASPIQGMASELRTDEDSSKIPDVSIVEASAELLYGLVHQRFIITRTGLQAMVSPHSSPPCADV
jgi:hypothetical protein